MSNSKITDSDDDAVPGVLRVSAALSWRVLVVLGMLYVLGQVVRRFYVVLIPVAIALLLAALLAPAVSRLIRMRVPSALATAIVMIGGLAAVGGVLTFVINAFITGFSDLQSQVLASFNQIQQWLANSPLRLSQQQFDNFIDQARQWLQRNQSALTSGALATATTFGTLLTGLLLMLFTLVFFLHDGRRIWLFLLRIVPRSARHRVDIAGSRGFASLVGYVRGTALVAVFDAVGIGIGLAIIGVPLAVPLSALIFLSSFVPIVGAIASGAVAVLVALVTKGPIAALLVLAVVLGVQQLEGNVMQPLIVGRAVHLHVLAVVLAVSAGVVLAGIVGALLAVPLMAVLNSAIRSLVSDEDGDTQVRPTDSHESLPPEERKDPEPPEKPAVTRHGETPESATGGTSTDESTEGGPDGDRTPDDGNTGERPDEDR
ncbi:putative PurR-regulated permease PerM [Halopolyspora algeriensis]|uniref:Putative PurR-regulated permease PerM n=1 Tax=Halopolyspora algeriensis TaxID=1500506 RepID=A0A368VYW6_9ACTN|nr:AI-2E family transporter [Halopolyspora algeriensis]RCW47197.1 putative PurR-regulated permease PerM [Halopolyspora algeriensis]TQM48283.1 putative PurR-regulated permease PerM [Halopolyspora algeriensis]